tara:strand:+ start:857 stop:1141 length:285 start_codon:yes stop_codon:yes gene_type:complete
MMINDKQTVLEDKMKNLIRSEFIICRIDERSFLHDSVLTANGIENEDSTCVELDIHATFNTKLEALEYLSNGDISVQDFIILERYKLVKLKEDK